MWHKPFEALNLYGGTINYISDDLEDMIEISYQDGMLIDIGKSSIDNIYYITVVSSNDSKGWQAPLEVVPVISKEELFGKIQATIEKYQKR